LERVRSSSTKIKTACKLFNGDRQHLGTVFVDLQQRQSFLMEKLEENGDFVESIAASLASIAYREGCITDPITGDVIQQVQTKPEPKKREAPEGKTQAIPDFNLLELQKN